jgi:starvation-inducible DNA-binding protein
LFAERVVTLGGTARGTIQAAVDSTTLPPFPLDERDERRLLHELIGRVEALDERLREGLVEAADEPVTQDVYIEVARGIEKQRWMLQAHLPRPPKD